MVADMQMINYAAATKYQTLRDAPVLGAQPITLTSFNPFDRKFSHAESVSPRSGLANTVGLGMNAPMEVDSGEMQIEDDDQ